MSQDPKRGVDVLQGLGLAVLLGVQALAPMLSQEDTGRKLQPASLVLNLGVWALGYYLARSTPAEGCTAVSIVAFAATILSVWVGGPVGIVLMPKLWWNRRSAIILAKIVEDERPAVDESALPRAPRSKRKKKRRKSKTTSDQSPVTRGMEPENLFPYLNRPSDSMAADTASERLVETWDDSPLVTLGWDLGRAVALAPRAELKEENKQRALRNLEARPERAEWETHRMPSPDGELDVFARIGDDLTASDLVDREFLRAAYALCGSKVVFFSIPTRESMVMASHPDPVALLAAQRFDDDELSEHPLCPHVFAFDGDGAFVPLIPQGL